MLSALLTSSIITRCALHATLLAKCAIHLQLLTVSLISNDKSINNETSFILMNIAIHCYCFIALFIYLFILLLHLA